MASTVAAMAPLDREAAHVAPINVLVGKLSRGGRYVPYVHQSQGGVSAVVLSVLRDPGKATGDTGVLCTDNPDPTSRVQRELMARVGLTRADMCPWNAYPWMTSDGRVPSVEDVAQGAVQLVEVLGLMTDLRALLLQGEHARWAWAMVQAFRPRYARPKFEVVATCHPLGTRGADPDKVRVRQADQLAAWERAAAAVHRPGRQP